MYHLAKVHLRDGASVLCQEEVDRIPSRSPRPARHFLLSIRGLVKAFQISKQTDLPEIKLHIVGQSLAGIPLVYFAESKGRLPW